MNWKRWLFIGLTMLLILSAVGYHLVFGYVIVSEITSTTFVIHRKSLLGQIGGNVVVHLGKKEITIVDSQLKPVAAASRAEAEQLSENPISLVIITHWHPDHSGGTAVYTSDTKVIAHKNTVAILAQPQEGFGLTKPDSRHTFAALKTDELPEPINGDQFANKNIEAVHYPNAHTGGDLVVYFDGVAAIGDLVWPNSFPFIDLHNGGTARGLELAIEKIVGRSESNDQFIPGHGGVLSLEEVTTYLNMVATTRNYVENQKAEGKSLEEIITLGLPDKWKNWSSNLVPEEVWITFIFESL